MIRNRDVISRQGFLGRPAGFFSSASASADTDIDTDTAGASLTFPSGGGRADCRIIDE